MLVNKTINVSEGIIKETYKFTIVIYKSNIVRKVISFSLVFLFSFRLRFGFLTPGEPMIQTPTQIERKLEQFRLTQGDHVDGMKCSQSSSVQKLLKISGGTQNKTGAGARAKNATRRAVSKSKNIYRKVRLRHRRLFVKPADRKETQKIASNKQSYNKYLQLEQSEPKLDLSEQNSDVIITMVKTPEFSPVSGTGPTGQPNKFQTQTNPGKPYSSRQYEPKVSPRSAPNVGKNFRDSFFDRLFQRLSSIGMEMVVPVMVQVRNLIIQKICENKPNSEFDQNKLQTPSSSKTKSKKKAKGDKKKKQDSVKHGDYEIKMSFDKNGNPIFTVLHENKKVAVFTYDKALEKYYHADVYNLSFLKNFDPQKAAIYRLKRE